MNDAIVTYLDSERIPYETNVDLKKRTWIHRGGIAHLWITPTSTEQLQQLCSNLYKQGREFKIIGQTSNLYFDNSYNPEIIICTTKLNVFSVTSNSIECECGVPVKTLAKYAVENGISGFEGLVDLPGTIAAATFNNSGCYNCQVSSLLKYVEFLSSNGEIKKLTPADLNYAERTSALKRREIRGVILKVILSYTLTDNADLLIQTARNNHAHRIQFQERPAQTLGSIFPNGVLRAFEMNLPRFSKICLKFIYKAHQLKLITYSRQQKSKRDIICLLNGMWGIHKYISPKNFNCFIWKDANADKAFNTYCTFVQQIAHIKKIEIEVIKASENEIIQQD